MKMLELFLLQVRWLGLGFAGIEGFFEEALKVKTPQELWNLICKADETNTIESEGWGGVTPSFDEENNTFTHTTGSGRMQVIFSFLKEKMVYVFSSGTLKSPRYFSFSITEKGIVPTHCGWEVEEMGDFVPSRNQCAGLLAAEPWDFSHGRMQSIFSLTPKEIHVDLLRVVPSLAPTFRHYMKGQAEWAAWNFLSSQAPLAVPGEYDPRREPWMEEQMKENFSSIMEEKIGYGLGDPYKPETYPHSEEWAKTKAHFEAVGWGWLPQKLEQIYLNA